jgi:probable LLM family oxidoreductase
MEIGVFTFAETTPDPETGTIVDAGERLRQVLAEAALADRLGLDVYGVGEHHRADFAASAPAVVLAAIAARTTRIRLTSAVSVLSSDDPVRVFQEFATVDLISGGRAEIMAGRGSFTESFPLFGYELEDYDTLFAEKLELLLRIRERERVSWRGRHRAPLHEAGVWPRPLQQPLPVWIAVGGTPASVARAGTLGLPLAVAIIGGQPERFGPLVDLYRRAGRDAGRDAGALRVGINCHAYVAESSDRAADEYFPAYSVLMNRVGRERGWPPITREAFDGMRSLRGALAVGTAEEVVEKVLFQHRIFNHDRVMFQISVGTLPHERVLRAIELIGTVVAPALRRALGTGDAWTT